MHIKRINSTRSQMTILILYEISLLFVFNSFFMCWMMIIIDFRLTISHTIDFTVVTVWISLAEFQVIFAFIDDKIQILFNAFGSVGDIAPIHVALRFCKWKKGRTNEIILIKLSVTQWMLWSNLRNSLKGIPHKISLQFYSEFQTGGSNSEKINDRKNMKFMGTTS